MLGDGLTAGLKGRGSRADTEGVHRDPVPVVTAAALLAQGTDVDVIVAHLRKTWHLDDIDATMAVSAARVLTRQKRLAEPGPSSAD